jgi:hypothetical protein
MKLHAARNASESAFEVNKPLSGDEIYGAALTQLRGDARRHLNGVARPATNQPRISWFCQDMTGSLFVSVHMD